MTFFFENPARVETLHATCESWRGTRFAQGLCAKGQGVDCVRFVIAVLEACSVPVSALGEVPAYSVHEGRHSTHTRLMQWLVSDLKARAHLERVDAIEAGDLLACKVHRGANHLGLARDHQSMWHCDMKQGVTLTALKPFKRIYAYRILNNFTSL